MTSAVSPPDLAARTLQLVDVRSESYSEAELVALVRSLMPGKAVYDDGEVLLYGDGPVVLSRATDEQISAVTTAWGGATVRGSTVVWRPAPVRPVDPVLVVTAGTADLPVADECEATLEAFGIPSALVVDVGVAGIHRLLARSAEIQRAPAVVVVAGMEGALASVIGGLTAAPVVAVPTSVGYGASLAGVTALLGMLSSCASGLVVVGIDNGFGAAFAIHRLLGLAP